MVRRKEEKIKKCLKCKQVFYIKLNYFNIVYLDLGNNCKNDNNEAPFNKHM